MHLAYLLTSSDKNKNILSQLEIFTIILSALCHDVGHTGYTNNF